LGMARSRRRMNPAHPSAPDRQCRAGSRGVARTRLAHSCQFSKSHASAGASSSTSAGSVTRPRRMRSAAASRLPPTPDVETHSVESAELAQSLAVTLGHVIDGQVAHAVHASCLLGSPSLLRTVARRARPPASSVSRTTSAGLRSGTSNVLAFRGRRRWR
jgi:hypothetical protein